MVNAVHVPAGTNIIMSILGANRNEQVWGEDASEWRPERWLTPSGERIGFDRHLDLAFDENVGDANLEGTPGTKGGIKYPGVYATMCVDACVVK